MLLRMIRHPESRAQHNAETWTKLSRAFQHSDVEGVITLEVALEACKDHQVGTPLQHIKYCVKHNWLEVIAEERDEGINLQDYNPLHELYGKEVKVEERPYPVTERDVAPVQMVTRSDTQSARILELEQKLMDAYCYIGQMKVTRG